MVVYPLLIPLLPVFHRYLIISQQVQDFATIQNIQHVSILSIRENWKLLAKPSSRAQGIQAWTSRKSARHLGGDRDDPWGSNGGFPIAGWSVIHWIGFCRKIYTGNHAFYHQIKRAFRCKFSHHPILWVIEHPIKYGWFGGTPMDWWALRFCFPYVSI